MRGPIDIDNVENAAREKSEGCGREGRGGGGGGGGGGGT